MTTPVGMNTHLVILMCLRLVVTNSKNDLVEECLYSICCLLYSSFWHGCDEQTAMMDTLQKDLHMLLHES
jgi:hypothetical protein